MKKWDTIRARSKIILKTDKEFMTLDGLRVIPKGEYFINGFWANAVGLCRPKDWDYKQQEGLNFACISSIDLKQFEGIK